MVQKSSLNGLWYVFVNLGLLPFYTNLGLLPFYTKLTDISAFTVLSEKRQTFTPPPPNDPVPSAE